MPLVTYHVKYFATHAVFIVPPEYAEVTINAIHGLGCLIFVRGPIKSNDGGSYLVIVLLEQYVPA